MKISFIYMASGFGSRFGSNKLLVPFKGKELYRHGLDCICRAAGELEKDGHQTEILVVSQYEEILEQAVSQGLAAVHNGFSGEGITASLRLGTASAAPGTEALLFSAADQPYMSPFTLKKFIRGFRLAGKGMGCVCHQGKRGNPAIFSRTYRQELMGLRGDRGGSVIMKAHPEDVWTMEVPEEELRDIDRAEDL